MSTKSKSPAKKSSTAKARRWSIGVFQSATSNEHIVQYCRVDGTVSPSYAKTVKTKKALFHATYSNVTYVEARKRLIAAAAKAGVKESKPAAKKSVAKQEHLKKAA